MKASYPEKLGVLNAVSLEDRFEKAFPLLERQIAGLRAIRDNQTTREQGSRRKGKVE